MLRQGRNQKSFGVLFQSLVFFRRKASSVSMFYPESLDNNYCNVDDVSCQDIFLRDIIFLPIDGWMDGWQLRREFLLSPNILSKSEKQGNLA